MFVLKIKNILFSQNLPIDFEKTPYAELSKKYNVKIDFFKFFQIKGISLNQFRKNKIIFSDYTAIVFTSKNAIDHFFSILKELKIELSTGMRFFCINESTALYLLKYITYRKRKMLFADGTAKKLVEILEENPEDKFLVPCSVGAFANPLLLLLKKRKINYKKAEVFQIVMADLRTINIKSYDLIVFFSPFGIQSLKSNFPDYQQMKTVIATLGIRVLEVAEEEGLKIEIMAPTAEHPSIFTAIDHYLYKVNGRKR